MASLGQCRGNNAITVPVNLEFHRCETFMITYPQYFTGTLSLVLKTSPDFHCPPKTNADFGEFWCSIWQCSPFYKEMYLWFDRLSIPPIYLQSTGIETNSLSCVMPLGWTVNQTSGENVSWLFVGQRKDSITEQCMYNTGVDLYVGCLRYQPVRRSYVFLQNTDQGTHIVHDSWTHALWPT